MGLLDFTSASDGDPTGGLMGMYANPQMAGLLGMSQGLLSAAGPSRIPVTTGQAMGAGFGGMQQGIGNALQNQRSMLLMRALQGGLGGGFDPNAPSGGQVTPSAPVTGGANTGAMSGLMAGMGGAAPTPQAAASSAQTANPAPTDPTSLLQAYNQRILTTAALGLPTAGIEAEMKYDPRLAYSMPTQDMVNAAAAFGQGTPEAQNALRGILNKNATVIGRAGGYAQNGANGQTTWFPNVPAGGMPVMDANGQPTGAIAPQPGAIDVMRNTAAAQASGPAQFKIVPGMQNGTPVNTTAYNIANGLPPAGQSGASNGAPAQGGAFSGYQAPNGAPVAPSLPPGANTLAEGSAKSFNDLRAQAGSTPTAIDGYNRAEQTLLDGVTTGPGSTLGTNIIGRLNTAGIPLLKGDATGFQSLQKYLSNANAQAAAASGYNGSDARFESFSHGQPSTENMNPQALRYAIQYVRGQQFGVQAKYQAAQSFLNQQGGNTVNYPQFEAQWNKVYSPDVALVKAMPNPADQQAYLAQLKQQGKLGAWMKSYQQMQQMGAY